MSTTDEDNNGNENSILPLSDGTPHQSNDNQSNDNDNDNDETQQKQQEQQSQSQSESTPISILDDNDILVQVSETLPDHDTIQKFLSSPKCGAISTFTGITRNNFAGKIVTHLSYEGYTPMAIKELKRVCRDAKSKYPTVDKLVAVHVLGECPVGEASVVVGCCSPHRREAIRCTEYLIDELKGRVPIWKKEIYESDGESVWKENVEWHEGRRRRVMVKVEEKVEEKNEGS